ncbi:hypothetical protein [Halomicrococcus sp. NG-SE-24]|uniref:hypothetical protein n=1 Tax=Halomicrococcus sp. NG-SE-24 TaxID=3436928 RepID=UPI003D97870D
MDSTSPLAERTAGPKNAASSNPTIFLPTMLPTLVEKLAVRFGFRFGRHGSSYRESYRRSPDGQGHPR